MSYDLMVFEPEAAPKEHQRFLTWYSDLTKWQEGHSYGDPAVTSIRLRNWFLEIAVQFPPIDGTTEELPEDEASASDYSIGKQFIYTCFAWSKAAPAYEAVFSLAEKHRLGFFNVSSDGGEVWLPSDRGLVLAHSNKKSGLMSRLRKMLSIN